LFLGRPGVGKTTLAKLVGKELGVPVVVLHAASADEGGSFVERVIQSDGGILFIDEIHALDRRMCESLYTVIDSGTLTVEEEQPAYGVVFRAIYSEELLPEGMEWDGPGNYPVSEQVGYNRVLAQRSVKAAIIGATTDEALLPAPLLSRLGGLKVHLRTYSAEELVQIVEIRAPPII